MAFNTCVVKNLNASDQSVLGVVLAQNEVYTIPDSKRISATNDSTILDRISQGVLQIGNGSNFFQTTAAQINYLNSVINSVSISEIDSNNSIQSKIKNFKLSRSSSDLALTTSYQDILNIENSGSLHGFKLVFSNDECLVRLEIDENEVFEISPEELRSMNYESHTNVGMNRFFGGSQFGEFEFFPNSSLAFTSSIKLQVKKTVSWGIDLEYRHIFYSEE